MIIILIMPLSIRRCVNLVNGFKNMTFSEANTMQTLDWTQSGSRFANQND